MIARTPDLTDDVAECDRLLGDHLAAAVQAFGTGALGVIDLPPLMDAGRLAPAQVRAAATLLWAMNVEGAGIPSFVDALANGVWTGRIVLPIGEAASKLLEYRRDLDDRFNLEERRALYEQLFGTSTGFASGFGRLIEAISSFGRAPLELGQSGMMARIAAAALDVGRLLSDRAVGVVGFAGREILAHVREALAVLGDPEIAAALGGGGRWSIIRLHSREVLGQPLDPSPHIDRAQAGLDILEWIAAHASAIESGAVSVDRDDPIVNAAERWRAAGGVAVDVRTSGDFVRSEVSRPLLTAGAPQARLEEAAS